MKNPVYLHSGFFFMISQNYSIYINSPVGILKLVSNETDLISLSFCNEKDEDSNIIPEILIETIKQLEEYFKGERKIFELNISPEGSTFQKSVWNLVLAVPFGKTSTYNEISKLTHITGNMRAIGSANGKNPLPIIIPCHRIIGSNGKLTGYSGGLESKKWLILHEQKHSKQTYLLF